MIYFPKYAIRCKIYNQTAIGYVLKEDNLDTDLLKKDISEEQKISHFSYLKTRGFGIRQSMINFEVKSPVVFENIPLSNFKIGSIEKRIVKIKDPRGFSIKIPAEDILDILKTDSISEKFIEGEYLYGWNSGTLHLISVNNPEYIDFKNSITADKCVSGERYKALGETNGYIYTCIGHNHIVKLKPIYRKFHGNQYHYALELIYRIKTLRGNLFTNEIKTPTHLFNFSNAKRMVKVSEKESEMIDKVEYKDKRYKVEMKKTTIPNQRYYFSFWPVRFDIETENQIILTERNQPRFDKEHYFIVVDKNHKAFYFFNTGFENTALSFKCNSSHVSIKNIYTYPEEESDKTLWEQVTSQEDIKIYVCFPELYDKVLDLIYMVDAAGNKIFLTDIDYGTKRDLIILKDYQKELEESYLLWLPGKLKFKGY